MLKIALLFLTIDGIYHENHWQEFLNSNENLFSVYIHSKNGVPTNSVFKKYELVQKIPTTWANTMRAQIELLRVALEDPLNEKFMFATESTIPLVTASQTYTTIFSTEKSAFRYWPNRYQYGRDAWSLARNLHKIPKPFRYENYQHILLNRKHAHAMVNDTKYIDIITQYASDQELYPASFLASQGLLHEIEPKDLTYVKWPHYTSPNPLTFSKFDNGFDRECILNAIADGFLFARKIAATADLSPLDPYLAYRKYKD